MKEGCRKKLGYYISKFSIVFGSEIYLTLPGRQINVNTDIVVLLRDEVQYFQLYPCTCREPPL